jgi:hypothetical protein
MGNRVAAAPIVFVSPTVKVGLIWCVHCYPNSTPLSLMKNLAARVPLAFNVTTAHLLLSLMKNVGLNFHLLIDCLCALCLYFTE